MKLKLLTSQIKFDIETWSLNQIQVKSWRLDLRLDSSSSLLACQELELDSSLSSSRDFRLASRVKSTHSSLKLDLTISLNKLTFNDLSFEIDNSFLIFYNLLFVINHSQSYVNIFNKFEKQIIVNVRHNVCETTK